MESINDYLQKILIEAQTPAREKAKSNNIYKPDHARFKAVIYFNNKNCGTWLFSFDLVCLNNEFHTDEYNGLFKLVRKINCDYKGLYKNAIIYATITDEKKTTDNYDIEIIQFNNKGLAKKNKYINMLQSGKNNYLDLKHIKNFKKIGNVEYKEIKNN